MEPGRYIEVPSAKTVKPGNTNSRRFLLTKRDRVYRNDVFVTLGT